MADDRASGPGMQFGSTHPTLFATGCSDPRGYVGPPILRRAMSSQGHRRPSPAPAKSPQRPHSSVSIRPPGQEVREGMLDDGVGAVSLDNIDIHREFNAKYPHLTSPRSITACRNLGITPADLLAVTQEGCAAAMRRAGEDTTDADVTQRRFDYMCKRRNQKAEAAARERQRLTGTSTSTVKGSTKVSSSVLAQERQLQKIVDANNNRLKQQLLHQEVLQRQREKEEENRAVQRRHDEDQREQQRQLELEKARKDEEAQRLRAEVKALQQREAAAAIEEKRHEAEEKDRVLQERLLRKRMLTEARNEAKRQHNVERRQAMREQAEAVAATRRETFKARWKQFMDSQRQFAEKRQDIKRARSIEADRKREKIERTKVRCDEVLQARIHRTQSREARAEEAQRQRALEREQEQDEKNEMDALKEAQREKVYRDAQSKHRAKVQSLSHKIQQAEERLDDMQREKDKEARIRRERVRESELDKRDCVERRRRADQHRRDELQRKIDAKARQVEDMKQQQIELSKRHRDMREEAERSRVRIVEATPGPLDYDTSPRVKDGPKWKFGLPAQVLAARQISREHHAEGYEASPGPCMYVPDTKRKTPQFSVCRTERWTSTAEYHQTPGPADYAAETTAAVSPTRNRKEGVAVL